MKKFEDFISEGQARKITPDKSRALSLIKKANERDEYISSLNESPSAAKTIIFEGLYEALKEYLDALLLVDGFISYSHEASIVYLQKFPSFTEYEVREFDNFRKIRNNSKYYGKPIQEDHLIRIKKLFPILKNKLLKMLKEKGV